MKDIQDAQGKWCTQDDDSSYNGVHGRINLPRLNVSATMSQSQYKEKLICSYRGKQGQIVTTQVPFCLLTASGGSQAMLWEMDWAAHGLPNPSPTENPSEPP